MFNYCLNRNELLVLFSTQVLDVANSYPDNQITLLLEEAAYWHFNLHCLNYLISKVIERYDREGIVLEGFVQDIYSLRETMWITIQEHDEKFVDYMFRHPRNESLSLDENLIEIQYNLSEYHYE